MKYVREYINEKFTEESDPIKDMGIGFKETFVLQNEKKYIWDYSSNEIKKNIRNIKLKENIKLKKKFIGKKVQGSFYDEKIGYWRNKIIKVNKIKIEFNVYLDNKKNIMISIDAIFLYTNKGKRYFMDSQYEYNITM